MSYAYKNLKTPQNVGSGVADFMLIAPVSDFVEGGIMCPEAPFTEPGDEVTIKTAHSFLAERGFAKWILATEKNKIDGATLGDKGFQKLDLTLEAMIPGSYAEQHEAIKNIINVPLIVLIKDSNCAADMYYQLGCDCVYAWATANFATGTTREGNKGYTISISYLGGYVQIYNPGTPPVVLNDNGSIS
jgi:hypothetical protein